MERPAVRIMLPCTQTGRACKQAALSPSLRTTAERLTRLSLSWPPRPISNEDGLAMVQLALPGAPEAVQDTETRLMSAPVIPPAVPDTLPEISRFPAKAARAIVVGIAS